MKAIRPSETGGPEKLRLEEYPTPTPGKGEVLAKVDAAGVNYIDVYHRTGLYKQPLPIPLGVEGAGVVEQVGADVRDLRPGDRIAWAGTPGSYATHVLVAAERAVPIPKGIEISVAAAALLQGLTAHYLTHSTFPLKRGHTALVHAAAGGVGLLLVQLAKRAGARIVATVSTPEKAALAKEAGADDVILYTKQDFEVETRRLTEGRGVDVVYDAVGKTTFEKSLNSLALRGCLVLYGQASGLIAPFDPQLLSAKGSLFLTRPTLAHYTSTRDELIGRSNELFALIRSGALKVRIERTYSLAQAAEAHRALEGRATTGKVLLLPGAS
jgi:NADPH2:quinone reductase